MPKNTANKRITRAQKVAAASQESTAENVIAKKVTRGKSKVTAAGSDNVTPIRRQSTPKTLPATYEAARVHRESLEKQLHATIEKIAESYAYEGPRERDERREWAEEALDYAEPRFNKNGFGNCWSRLVMAHLMLDLLGPVGDRTQKVIRLIEDAFGEEKLPSYLRKRIDDLRERDRKFHQRRNGGTQKAA